MTREEFDALHDWIKALIDERIDMRLHRDCMHESVRRSELEEQVLKLLKEST